MLRIVLACYDFRRKLRSWFYSKRRRLAAWWKRLKLRFWLWIYRLAGKHVGPEVNEYWDQHWWKVVAYRLKEAGDSDLGLSFVRLLLEHDEGSIDDGQGRDYRAIAREIRDSRG